MVREVPVIFPNSLVHKDMADTLIRMCPGFEGGKAVSGGFLSSTGLCQDPVHGESESLKLKSRPEDTDLILMHDYLHGIKDRD